MDQSNQLRFLPQAGGRADLRRCLIWLTVVVITTISSALPQDREAEAVALHGTVFDAANRPVPDASVTLERKGAPAVTTRTNPQGWFTISAPVAGSYSLRAEKLGLRSRVTTVPVRRQGEARQVDLVLQASGVAPSTQAMEFADQPNFTVAGVTDWTAVGGHGSDATLRTSESLTRETLTLQPQGAVTDPPGAAQTPASTTESEKDLRAALVRAPRSFEANHRLGELYLHTGRYRESASLLETAYAIDPANRGNELDLALARQQSGDLSAAREQVRRMIASQDTPALHKFLGELDEQLGDPLAAVHEYEHAARLDPSEQNYFAWGSELLLHRAIWQAQEVFGKGVATYPKSARMLTGLGAALFAGDLYDQAAQRLCEASDLDPSGATPYVFLGKIEIAAPAPLGCVEPRLARFADQQPGSALANYYYAMALWKRQDPALVDSDLKRIKDLLLRAVAINPECGEAYLQLGIMASAQHEVSEAISFYERAIAASPDLAEAHYRLGGAYDRTGDAAKARQQLELHDELEKSQLEDIERERREVKQFLVVLQGQPATSSPH